MSGVPIGTTLDRVDRFGVSRLKRCVNEQAYRRELDRRITHDQLGLDWQGELVGGMLMGSGEVIGHWKRLLAKQANGDLRGESRRFGVVSWEEIIAAIEKEWRQPWQELQRIRGNNAQEP